MIKQKNIRREIVDVERWMNRGWEKSRHVGGMQHCALECGHTHYRKISAGLPACMKVRCQDCERLRDGCISRLGNIRETWDAAKQWPIRTEVSDE